MVDFTKCTQDEADALASLAARCHTEPMPPASLAASQGIMRLALPVFSLDEAHPTWDQVGTVAERAVHTRGTAEAGGAAAIEEERHVHL